MNGDLVRHVHFVEFINAANALQKRVIINNLLSLHGEVTLSASIKAPASIENWPVSSSLTTAAVRPAAVEALPEVYTARGKKLHTYLMDVSVQLHCKNVHETSYFRN
jgi:hypothetical protein